MNIKLKLKPVRKLKYNVPEEHTGWEKENDEVNSELDVLRVSKLARLLCIRGLELKEERHTGDNGYSRFYKGKSAKAEIHSSIKHNRFNMLIWYPLYSIYINLAGKSKVNRKLAYRIDRVIRKNGGL